MVAYQEEVRDPSRIAEVLNRVIRKAKRASAPAQINVPRDFWTQVIDIELPAVVEFERPTGGADAIARAAARLREAKFPVIVNGAGVVLAGVTRKRSPRRCWRAWAKRREMLEERRARCGFRRQTMPGRKSFRRSTTKKMTRAPRGTPAPANASRKR